MLEFRIVGGNPVIYLNNRKGKVISMSDLRAFIFQLLEDPVTRPIVFKAVALKRIEDEKHSREFVEMCLRQALQSPEGNSLVVSLLHEYGFSYVEVPVMEVGEE